MTHWFWVAIVIEATALASWIAAAATRQTKVAFAFGFNLMAAVAGLHLAASGEFGWRSAIAVVSVALYLVNMNVVVLLWTNNTALPKLDRVLGPFERHALPLVVANGVGWLYCLPFYFIGRRAGPLHWPDALAVVAYVVGTGIHFAADSARKGASRGARARRAGFSTKASGATAVSQLLWRLPRVCQRGAVRRQSVGLGVARGELRAVHLRRHPQKRSLGCGAIWSGMVVLRRPNRSVLPMGAASAAGNRRRTIEGSASSCQDAAAFRIARLTSVSNIGAL